MLRGSWGAWVRVRVRVRRARKGYLDLIVDGRFDVYEQSTFRTLVRVPNPTARTISSHMVLSNLLIPLRFPINSKTDQSA